MYQSYQLIIYEPEKEQKTINLIVNTANPEYKKSPLVFNEDGTILQNYNIILENDYTSDYQLLNDPVNNFNVSCSTQQYLNSYPIDISKKKRKKIERFKKLRLSMKNKKLRMLSKKLRKKESKIKWKNEPIIPPNILNAYNRNTNAVNVECYSSHLCKNSYLSKIRKNCEQIILPSKKYNFIQRNKKKMKNINYNKSFKDEEYVNETFSFKSNMEELYKKNTNIFYHKNNLANHPENFSDNYVPHENKQSKLLLPNQKLFESLDYIPI